MQFKRLNQTWKMKYTLVGKTQRKFLLAWCLLKQIYEEETPTYNHGAKNMKIEKCSLEQIDEEETLKYNHVATIWKYRSEIFTIKDI